MTSCLLRPVLARPLVILLALLCLLAAHSPSATAAVVYPNSIAATGDSITRAFNTGSSAFADAPANSWSTGTNGTVQSLYLRILANNPAINGRNYNAARSGAKMVDLAGQAATVNGLQVEYITILMGANDVCTSSEATMTSVETFRTQFQSAMQTLASGSPNARIYVTSVPNIYNLWSVLKGNSSARATWSFFGICQSMLANPLSTNQTDVARRERVRQRNIDFNTQLQQVCAQYPQCRFDNNAVFNTTFVPSDVSTRDYFHPSLAGQTKLANVTWQASGLVP
jgi:lysophospholipase L1-like esterase